MKITSIGWVLRTQKPEIIKVDGEYHINGVLSERGNKSDWLPKYWPPRKVRITIEDVK